MQQYEDLTKSEMNLTKPVMDDKIREIGLSDKQLFGLNRLDIFTIETLAKTKELVSYKWFGKPAISKINRTLIKYGYDELLDNLMDYFKYKHRDSDMLYINGRIQLLASQLIIINQTIDWYKSNGFGVGELHIEKLNKITKQLAYIKEKKSKKLRSKSWLAK